MDVWRERKSGLINFTTSVLFWIIQYNQRHSMINHCDRHITLLSDTDISVGLFYLYASFICLLGDRK